jgi:hypothetical protein
MEVFLQKYHLNLPVVTVNLEFLEQFFLNPTLRGKNILQV